MGVSVLEYPLEGLEEKEYGGQSSTSHFLWYAKMTGMKKTPAGSAHERLIRKVIFLGRGVLCMR